MKKRILAIAVGLALCVAAVAAATMKEIILAEGYDDSTRITIPIFDSTGLPTVDVAITSAYDRKLKFVRRTGGRLPATRGPEYDLDPKVDLAALLTEAMRAEASAMGLAGGAASGPKWRVTGVVKEAYLESRQVYMGATLFYGYIDVELQVQDPSGASQTRRLRAHNYSGGYSAGFSRKNEAESAAAHLLVEGAQDILARLNRDFFKVPVHRDMAAKLQRLQTSGAKGSMGDLRHVGLSGLPSATPALLAMVPKEADENVRAAIIDALGLLGSPDAVGPLAGRYATEDEDCRWHTLKAMDYIGGRGARQLVTTQGSKDEDTGPRRLADRIAKAPADPPE